MVNINLHYYQEGTNGRSGNWFRLISENGDYKHEGNLKKGNEDYYAFLLFLNSRKGITFDLVIDRKNLSEEKFESLDELLKIHNAAVPDLRKR